MSRVTLSAPLDCNRTRPGVRPSRRVSLRGRAVVTALVFVLSSWFGLVHEATTTHVRCAQHGELMDSGANAIARPAEAAVDANVRDVAETTSQGHEHCALASAMRESRVVPRPPLLVAAPLVTAGPVVAGAPAAETSHDRALYRTAPKTSPPA